MAGTQLSMNGGRTDFLHDEDYFMAVAFLAAQRSKDPSSQVGACIVSQDGKVVGIGYNCMPNGCDDNVMPWGRDGKDELKKKYFYVCHAELNAIMNKFSADVRGCTIYVALFPCNECAKVIIQSGLKKVVYYSDKYHDKPETIASERMLEEAGITVVSFKAKSKTTQIAIDFNSIDPPKTGETVTAEQSKETDEN